MSKTDPKTREVVFGSHDNENRVTICNTNGRRCRQFWFGVGVVVGCNLNRFGYALVEITREGILFTFTNQRYTADGRRAYTLGQYHRGGAHRTPRMVVNISTSKLPPIENGARLVEIRDGGRQILLPVKTGKSKPVAFSSTVRRVTIGRTTGRSGFSLVFTRTIADEAKWEPWHRLKVELVGKRTLFSARVAATGSKLSRPMKNGKRGSTMYAFIGLGAATWLVPGTYEAEVLPSGKIAIDNR